jgi:hypothetical protein
MDRGKTMTRFVLAADMALVLAERRARLPGHHQLLAPTLIRSQMLAQLFVQVQAGQLDRQEAAAQLDYLRGLKLRLLGDRVLQRMAWTIAEALAWPDTYIAEYVALTKLQADALLIGDPKVRQVAARIVPVATLDDLLS